MSEIINSNVYIVDVDVVNCNMVNNIKKKIEGDKKVRANITLDQSLLDALDKYKTDNEIKTLSPMINAMLWDWLDKNQEDKLGEDVHK